MSANRPAKSRLSDRWWLQPILKNIALLGTNISHPLKEDILLSSQEGISQIGSFSQFSFREHLIHLAKLYNTIFHQPIYRFPWNKGSHFPYLNHHHLVGPGRGTAFCWRLSAKASKCPLPRARSIEWSAACDWWKVKVWLRFFFGCKWWFETCPLKIHPGKFT